MEKNNKDAEINVQNFPRRKNIEIRNVVTCPEDTLLVSFDYAQLEARVLAMASKDKTFCEAIWNNTDTHLKWATRLSELYPDVLNILKEMYPNIRPIKSLRDDIKNSFVFAGFYGAGKNSIMKHYETEFGIPNEVIETLYKEFWSVYTDVKRWQNELSRFCNNNGYVASLTGRKRRAPLTFNQIINHPIQSSASYDICIVSGDRLSEIAYSTKKPQYQYRLNVHDDLSFYIPKSSLEEDIFFIGKEMVRPIYRWIIVPLEVEFKIGTHWGDMKEVGKINTTEFWDYKGDGVWEEKK